MPLVEWNNTFSIGVQEIDGHHRHLVELINRTSDSLVAEDSRQNLKEVFEALLDYSVYHFSAEEKLMKETRFPGQKSHIVAHNEFARWMLEKLAMLHRGEPLTLELLTFLYDWLTEHILGLDARLGAHVHQVSS